MGYLNGALIATVDLFRSECSNQYVLISKDLISEFPGDYKIICINCFKMKDFSEPRFTAATYFN